MTNLIDLRGKTHIIQCDVGGAETYQLLVTRLKERSHMLPALTLFQAISLTIIFFVLAILANWLLKWFINRFGTNSEKWVIEMDNEGNLKIQPPERIRPKRQDKLKK